MYFQATASASALWHSSLLDRHRPLWETHLIAALQDGRFAVCTKIHHVLVDGISALKLLQGSLSSDPDDDQIRPPWSASPSRKAPQRQRPCRLRYNGAERLTRLTASLQHQN